jgi:hypothetical protein
MISNEKQDTDHGFTFAEVERIAAVAMDANPSATLYGVMREGAGGVVAFVDPATADALEARGVRHPHLRFRVQGRREVAP